MSLLAIRAFASLNTYAAASGFAALFALAGAGCAETDTGDDDAPDTGTAALPGSTYDSGTPVAPYDAGYTSPLPSYDAGSSIGVGPVTVPPRSDAGSPSTGLPNLGSDAGLPNLFGDGGITIPDIFGSSDAGQSQSDAGHLSPSDPMCQGAICFDVFDCYIFSPDKLNCGFTACDLGTCK